MSSLLSPQLPISSSCRPEIGVQAAVWRALRLAGVRVDSAGARHVVAALSWFVRQQPKILHRFDPEQNDLHTLEGFGPDSYWHSKFDTYLNRANQLTMESPQGRQAIAEFAATAFGMLESVWRVYGPPDSVNEDWSNPKVVMSDAVKRE